MYNKGFLKQTSLTSLAIASVCLLLTGCGQKNNELASPQGQALLKTQSIVQKSGGNWNNLSPADQQVLINGPGGGTVQGAQSFLAASAARLVAHPGPPTGVINHQPPPGVVSNNTPPSNGQ